MASKGEKALLAHTGLRRTEFEQLCVHFEQAWHGYVRYYTLEGKLRQRAYTGRERKNAALPSVEDKLLFVLYYLKTNPLQEVLASAFSE